MINLKVVLNFANKAIPFTCIILYTAIETQQMNLRRVRRIITIATKELREMQYSHVGTPATWQARMEQLDDMMNRLNEVPVKEVKKGYNLRHYTNYRYNLINN